MKSRPGPKVAGSTRPFSISFLASLFGLAAVYFAAAIIIDPHGDFETGRFPILTSDSRVEKIFLFQKFAAKGPVDGLIVGSSRSMEVDPKELHELTGLRFFNFSVDSAHAEDDLAIYRWARRQNPEIKVLLIGLDVEALHNDDLPNSRFSSNPSLTAALGVPIRMSPVSFWRVRVAPVLTASYAEDMARSVNRALRPHRAAETPHAAFDADGYLHYAQWEEQVAAGTFDRQLHINASRDEYLRRFQGMTGLSPLRCRYLETLLREAAADGVNVRIWITPVHPVVASYLSKATRYAELLDMTRAYVSGLGQKFPVKTFDFSEPALFGGNTVDWWDGAHANPRNETHITQALALSLKR